jgi:hypothetical protein
MILYSSRGECSHSMGYKYRLHYIKHKMLSMYKLPPPIYKAPLYIKSIKKAYSIYIQRFMDGINGCWIIFSDTTSFKWAVDMERWNKYFRTYQVSLLNCN